MFNVQIFSQDLKQRNFFTKFAFQFDWLTYRESWFWRSAIDSNDYHAIS